MARTERGITINIIKKESINNRSLAEYFARKFCEKRENIRKEKS